MAPKSRVEFNERVDIARETPVENFHDFFSERLSHFNLDTKDLTPQKIIEEIGDASEDLKKEFSEFLETFFYDMDWTMAAVEKRSGKEDRGFLKLFKFIMEVINDPSLSKYRSGHDNVAPRSRDKINEERGFYLPESVINDLFDEKSKFNQMDLILQHSHLNRNGVCFGLAVEFTRFRTKRILRDPKMSDEEINRAFLAKVRNDIKKDRTNFIVRIQLYQDYLQNKHVQASSPKDLSAKVDAIPSDMVGIIYNYKDNDGVERYHIVNIIKNRDLDGSYTALNVNEGFTKNSRDVGGGENLLKNLIYRDQQSLPVDSRYIALVDLSRIVRENELVPGLINTKGHNKKYNAEQFSDEIKQRLELGLVRDQDKSKLDSQLRFLNSKIERSNQRQV